MIEGMKQGTKSTGTNLDCVGAFLDFVDEEGVANREKIARKQRIIRRVEMTDPNKSYEDADPRDAAGGYPAGVVLEDGRLIGFGIHILNEDIYPLQSFEIYLRACDLAGPLDLSGQEALLFVDIYHNRVSAIDVAGDRALRILGIQDNRIEELDVSDLVACQGIDAGKNRLAQLEVSRNHELVELYVNDNRLTSIDLQGCPKLKYFYCQGNAIGSLDTRSNPLLRHLNATQNPLTSIRSLAPQRDEALPLELSADGPGYVGLQFNPVYNAQWKETGEWQQIYHAYPQKGHAFCGWFDATGALVSCEAAWQDEYGSSRVLTAKFE